MHSSQTDRSLAMYRTQVTVTSSEKIRLRLVLANQLKVAKSLEKFLKPNTAAASSMLRCLCSGFSAGSLGPEYLPRMPKHLPTVTGNRLVHYNNSQRNNQSTHYSDFTSQTRFNS